MGRYLTAAVRDFVALDKHIGRAHAARRRMNPRAIRYLIKKSALRIGIDPKIIGGHSLRAGCLTYRDLEGVTPQRIREHSGHEGMQGLLPYIRRPRKIGDSPLCLTHWIG